MDKGYGVALLLGVAALLICQLNAASVPTGRKDYTSYKVLQIFPENVQSVTFLRELMLSEDTLDFWEEPSYPGRSVQIMVAPGDLPSLTRRLENADIRFSVYRENVQEVLEPMWKEIDARAARSDKAFDITDFNNYDDLSNWMLELQGQCQEGYACQRLNLGLSHLGKNIYSFSISKAGANRQIIYIDATIHAREWISTATLTSILDMLARGTTAEARRLTDLYDWQIIPVVNPDGYEYTWTSDRYWRKNRNPGGGNCVGTDLNRNFDYAWGTDGISNSPCNQVYCGSSPASEVETRVIQAELRRIAPRTKALITIHSKGQMWMFSWGTTVDHAGRVCQRTEDHSELMPVADAAADAVQRTYGTVWTRGNSCEVIYATSGSTMDFAKGVTGIKYAFTLELRGDDWVIDRSFIPISTQEVFNGIVATVDAMP